MENKWRPAECELYGGVASNSATCDVALKPVATLFPMEIGMSNDWSKFGGSVNG
ncbi:MAG: hypothetical protein U9Q68_03555 [Euryarchaeota archaeon]|nr:hypothetical protein [Euryarchaeota archaeon]